MRSGKKGLPREIVRKDFNSKGENPTKNNSFLWRRSPSCSSKTLWH